MAVKRHSPGHGHLFNSALWLLLLLAVGCSSTQPTLPLTVGQGVMAGTAWRVRAVAEAGQICLLGQLVLGSVEETAGTCGPAAPPSDAFSHPGLSGGTAPGSDKPVIAAGVTRDDVARVQIELIAGDTIEANVVPLASWGVPANAFAGAIPPDGQVSWYVAFDSTGAELGRWRGPAAPVPTAQ